MIHPSAFIIHPAVESREQDAAAPNFNQGRSTGIHLAKRRRQIGHPPKDEQVIRMAWSIVRIGGEHNPPPAEDG